MIHRRVAMAQKGENPYVITKLPSGWAVMGDHQYLRGYTLLLPDPVVDDLNALTLSERERFLLDMSLIGDALLACTDAIRINYEILGNTDAALHAHIFARYRDEPDEYRVGPVWHYSEALRQSARFNERAHGELRTRLAHYLNERS